MVRGLEARKDFWYSWNAREKTSAAWSEGCRSSPQDKWQSSEMQTRTLPALLGLLQFAFCSPCGSPGELSTSPGPVPLLLLQGWSLPEDHSCHRALLLPHNSKSWGWRFLGGFWWCARVIRRHWAGISTPRVLMAFMCINCLFYLLLFKLSFLSSKSPFFLILTHLYLSLFPQACPLTAEWSMSFFHSGHDSVLWERKKKSHSNTNLDLLK